VIQAEGGLMSVTGDADGPPFRVGVAIADLVAGLLAAQGILLSLYARERGGQGQHVDISMLDGVVSLLSYHASIHLTTGTAPGRVGNRHATIAPYDTFQAADGEFFLAIGNDEQFGRFCRVTGLEALVDDERFSTNPARVRNGAELKVSLTGVLSTRPRTHWIELLTTAGVPCGSVRDVAGALSDPQIEARRMIEAVEHVAVGSLKVLGVPIKLSATPGAVRAAPPVLGQHTDAVLQELGFERDAIGKMRRDGVI
jgi:crotonobetainyl-CoA:carnitine CoA-transferase CaiB-like acyl-CoA transferase